MATKRKLQAAATRQKLIDEGTRLLNEEAIGDVTVDDLVKMVVVCIYGSSAVGYIAPDKVDLSVWPERMARYAVSLFEPYRAAR